MAAVAKNPAFAKKVGIKSSVGEDFLQADKGRTFGSGGYTRPDRQKINKPKTAHGAMALFSKGGDMKESKAMAKKEIAFMERKGAPKSMVKHEKEEYGMKKGGMKKMASGGITSAKMGSVRTAAPSRDGVATKGKTRGMMLRKGGMC